MQSITLYQCIPSYKPLATVRRINSLAGSNFKIHLDLEDSIQDVQNPELTPELKATARRDFAEIVKNLPERKISVRINSIRSPEFQKDKELLLEFRDCIESVFIPKVESRNDLEQFFKALSGRFPVNLIIESQKGINNLDEILSGNTMNPIGYVFFGNYDYHLDTNTFPITEQYSPEYWRIVETVISKAEQHNLHFGNSPYANIADTSCLDFAFRQLTNRCKKGFALMSLHRIQTGHFQKLISDWDMKGPGSTINNHADFTLESFTENKQKGRSFAIDATRRIITPQEYLLLLKRQNG